MRLRPSGKIGAEASPARTFARSLRAVEGLVMAVLGATLTLELSYTSRGADSVPTSVPIRNRVV